MATDSIDRRRPHIFLICNQKDVGPTWEAILQRQGLRVTLEPSFEKAYENWYAATPDLVLIDVDLPHDELKKSCENFRKATANPMVLLLPSYHETHILDAYAAGMDEVAIKPISPPVLLAKIMAWARRSWSMPIDGLQSVRTAAHKLDPARRSLIVADGAEIKLTNLEFRLLHLLMSAPEHAFETAEILHTVYGGYGEGDPILLKNVVYRLRKKIERQSGQPLIKTWGGGYSLQA